MSDIRHLFTNSNDNPELTIGSVDETKLSPVSVNSVTGSFDSIEVEEPEYLKTALRIDLEMYPTNSNYGYIPYAWFMAITTDDSDNPSPGEKLYDRAGAFKAKAKANDPGSGNYDKNTFDSTAGVDVKRINWGTATYIQTPWLAYPYNSRVTINEPYEENDCYYNLQYRDPPFYSYIIDEKVDFDWRITFPQNNISNYIVYGKEKVTNDTMNLVFFLATGNNYAPVSVMECDLSNITVEDDPNNTSVNNFACYPLNETLGPNDFVPSGCTADADQLGWTRLKVTKGAVVIDPGNCESNHGNCGSVSWASDTVVFGPFVNLASNYVYGGDCNRIDGSGWSAAQQNSTSWAVTEFLEEGSVYNYYAGPTSWDDYYYNLGIYPGGFSFPYSKSRYGFTIEYGDPGNNYYSSNTSVEAKNEDFDIDTTINVTMPIVVSGVSTAKKLGETYGTYWSGSSTSCSIFQDWYNIPPA